MAYNRLRFDVEFKNVTEKEVLNEELKNRNKKLTYNELFTIENLLEFRKPFADYIKKYGSELPVRTSYSFLNRIGNRVATYTGIHTNQPTAKSILKIIDQAKEYKDKNAVGKKAKAIEVDTVLEALCKIRAVYNHMIESNLSGSTKTCIENIFKKFKLDLPACEQAENISNEEKSKIEAEEHKLVEENKIKEFRKTLAYSRLVFKLKPIGSDENIQLSAKEIMFTYESYEGKRILSPVLERLTLNPY